MEINRICKQAQGELKSIRESIYARMRDRPRFDVNVKAEYHLKDRGAQKQECRITNLSASGAAVRFPAAETISQGTPLVLDIAIPNTILRVSAEAEIIWVKQRFSALIGGIRFTSNISENLIQRLADLT